MVTRSFLIRGFRNGSEFKACRACALEILLSIVLVLNIPSNVLFI